MLAGPRLVSRGFSPTSRRYLTTTTDQWRRVISEKNSSINALVYTTPAPPIPTNHGTLAGVAIAVKDNIATYDSPTTCSSLMLNGNVPTDSSITTLNGVVSFCFYFFRIHLPL